MTEREKKKQKLDDIIRTAGKVAVAFSGGVDSAYLLYEAHRLLGEDVLAVTARSAAVPESELSEAISFCQERGIRHIVRDTEELKLPEYRSNSEKRCYFCKREIFKMLSAEAAKEGFGAIFDGSNTDDDGDYRPGMAALKELGIRSPLKEAGYSKADIRFFSEAAHLPTWDKPSFACLASRIPYGDEITEEKLKMAGDAELFLRKLGFKQFRVRIHGKLARIETLPEDFERITSPELREKIYDGLKEIGFVYTALDLKGYRQGSMNELIL